jgi:sec-independent protein translocase protein TatA
MLGSLGLPEILFIFVIALLVFGPRRLPEIGRTLGKALGEFRRATTDLKRSFDAEAASIEESARPVPTPEPLPGTVSADGKPSDPPDSPEPAAIDPS